MASEMGVLKIPEDEIVTKWRLQPGKDALGRSRAGPAHSRRRDQGPACQAQSLSRMARPHQLVLEDLPGAPTKGARSNLPLLDRQQAFGYTQEDINILMTPMASTGEEANGSMGNDTPISALVGQAEQLFTYFKQNFAQVTNPPIDPIREELVMKPRLDHRAAAESVRPAGLGLHQAAGSTPADPDGRGPGKIRSISEIADTHFRSRTLDTTFHAASAGRARTGAGRALRARPKPPSRGRQHHHPVRPHGRLGPDSDSLAAGLRRAVHHHLIRTGLRTSVGLVVESGEPREVHHFACLAGYGAEAINPYLASRPSSR